MTGVRTEFLGCTVFATGGARFASSVGSAECFNVVTTKKNKENVVRKRVTG